MADNPAHRFLDLGCGTDRFSDILLRRYDSCCAGLADSLELLPWRNRPDLRRTAMRSGDTDGVYGDLVYVGRCDADRIVRYWRAGAYRPRAFRRGWSPPHPTFFCRTSLYRTLGGFDPAYRIAGDFELMLRFIEKNGIRVRYVPRPLVRMRAGGRANTIRGIVQGNREIARAFHRNGMGVSAGFFCNRLVSRVRQLLCRSCVGPDAVEPGQAVATGGVSRSLRPGDPNRS